MEKLGYGWGVGKGNRVTKNAAEIRPVSRALNSEFN